MHVAEGLCVTGRYQEVQERYLKSNPTSANVQVLFSGEGPYEYANTVHSDSTNFDVIIVDGASNRYLCAREGLKHLNAGGIMILDNSEWYPHTASMLRISGLIQVDFYGFKATESHTSTTSIFFHRDYQNSPLHSRQPSLLPGQIRVGTEWDHEPKAKIEQPASDLVLQAS